MATQPPDRHVPIPTSDHPLDGLVPSEVAIDLLATALVRLVTVAGRPCAGDEDHADSHPGDLEPSEHAAVSLPTGERAGLEPESPGNFDPHMETPE